MKIEYKLQMIQFPIIEADNSSDREKKKKKTK